MLSKTGKLKILLIFIAFVAISAAALSACAITSVDGVKIYSDSVLAVGDKKLYFSLNERVDTAEALSSLGITVESDEGESYVLTKDALESGYFRFDKIDSSTAGERSVTLSFNKRDYLINYVVDSYTVNFYLPDGELYKTVTPNGRDGSAEINLSTDYNYAVDSTVISEDEEAALKFCGWLDEEGNSVTGKYVINADEDHTATVNFYADFLTDEEFSAFNIYYDGGEKVFGGLSANSSYYWNDCVYVPESVTKIDLYSALGNLGEVEKLYVPSTAGADYSYLYYAYPANSLKYISVSVDNPNFSSYGGGLYTKDYSTLIYFPSSATEFSLRGSVKKINDYAFSYSSLSSVDLTGVTALGKYCFAYSDIREINCSAETASSQYSFLFSNMCEVYNEYDGENLIASYFVAHEDGSPVYYLDYVSPSVTEYTVKEGTEEINAYAFWGCSKLKSVELPDGLISIGKYAFAYCTSLKEITLPSSIKSSGAGAFYNCSSLSSIGEIPAMDYISDSSVKLNYLPDYFLYGTALKSVALGEGFLAVGKYSLAEMTRLAKAYMPDSLLYFDERAFSGDVSLYKVSFSEDASFERIGTEAFAYCTFLSSFHFEKLKNFEKIEPRAFMYSGICTFSFGEDYNEIDECAFEKCASLVSVSFGEDLTSIGKYAFKDCVSLKDVDFENIYNIGEGAFENCAALKEIVLADSVYIVGSYAFKDCTSLETVVVGEIVGRFGEYEFDKDGNVLVAEPVLFGCTSLKEIIVDSENPNFSSERGILYNHARDTLYVIPSAYEMNLEIEPGIRFIYPYAICYYALETFSIPESVERIYSRALYSIDELKTIYVSSSVIKLAADFFDDCPNLSAITVDEENEYYYNDKRGDVYNTCPDDETDVDVISIKDTPAFILSTKKTEKKEKIK